MIDIKGFEKLYAITKDGKVWSYNYENFLTPLIHPQGYFQVMLYKDKVPKRFYIHRLVFEHFGDMELDDTKVINHIDGNKINNDITNLEQVSKDYNAKHAFDNNLCHSNFSSRKVRQYDLNDNFIKEYKSIGEASASVNCDNSAISKVCRGKRNKCGGFKWRYVDE